MSRQIKHFYNFGPFRLDAAERQLWRAGEVVPLTPKAFDLLQALVEGQGHLLEKEELMKAVWPDAFVEEANLSHNISQIRRILGDGENGQRYIETVPKRGYRFVGAVQEAGQDLVGGNESDGLAQSLLPDERVVYLSGSRGEKQVLETSAGESAPRRQRSWLWVVGLLTLAAACAGVIWLVQSPGVTRQSSLLPVPLTAYPGWEYAPSFSPDGNQIVFAWNGEKKQDNFDIYVKLIGTGGQMRLTNHPEHEGSPVWSPDGRWIAFLRLLKPGKAAVLLIPALGGPERTLAEVHFSGLSSRRFFTRDLAWHPGGKWLAVPDRLNVEGTATQALFLLSTETGEARRLTSPPSGFFGDSSPSFSPDGLHLAFARAAMSTSLSYLYLLDLAEDLVPQGEPKRVGFEKRRTGSPVWTRDGREVVFTSGPTHRIGLWRMAASLTGKPEPMTFAMEGVGHPAISTHGNRLAYVSYTFDVNIWRLSLVSRGQIASPAANLIASTRVDHTPKFSPDGKNIVFTSFRSGTPEIWVSDADGSKPAQLTALGATSADNPCWSPDGQRIAFHSTVEGNGDIYVISAEGGKSRQLTNSAASDSEAHFSRDGQWIYFSSDRGGAPQLWKMPANGGEALRVTKHEARLPVESMDGKFLYYLKGQLPRYSLWRMPLAGGEESQVLESVYAQNFEVVNEGVYFIPQADQQGRYAIQFLNFATGKTHLVASIDKDVMFGLAVSPDEKTILYTQVDHEGSDLMLVENFR